MHLQPLPAFEDNYIWLLRDDGGRALIVDPGEAGPVLAALADALNPAELDVILDQQNERRIP